MVGRIFEAQPPTEIDEHQDLAGEVYQMASSLLNRYAITTSQNAAMAQLALYALAAMANSNTQVLIKTVKELGANWFIQQTVGDLCNLQNIWSASSVSVAPEPRTLLNSIIQMLKSDDLSVSGETDAHH
jgi:hypothetical protein